MALKGAKTRVRGPQSRSRVVDDPWRLQRTSDAAKQSRQRSRLLRTLEEALKRGEPFESVYRAQKPARRQPARFVFRYVPTGERLLLDHDQDGWAVVWAGVRRRLDHWDKVQTADGESWVVTQPEGGESPTTIPSPYRPHPGLKKVLFDGWYGAMVVGGRRECAAERRQAMAATQIIKALAEAVERGGLKADALLEKLETVAARYLKGLKFKSQPEQVPWHRQGLKLVLDRPAALQGLAHHWMRHLPPHDDSDSTFSVAERFLADLRQGSNYAKVAAELPRAEAAGTAETKRLEDRFVEASEAVRKKRRALLCARCAPGRGGLGRDKRVHYASPIPGDTAGWGCEKVTPTGKVCGPLAEESVHQERWELAKGLVRDAAVILGYSRQKARHLYSFEEKRSKRSSRGC
jgi:hypothetical protein